MCACRIHPSKLIPSRKDILALALLHQEVLGKHALGFLSILLDRTAHIFVMPR